MAETGEPAPSSPSTSAPQRQYTKRYTLIRKIWSKNYDWLLDDGSDLNPKDTPLPTCVINASSFTRGKPTLTLHDGPDATSPVVGCAWIPATSRSKKLGLGDCVNAPQDVKWEELRQENFRASEFSFGMSLPGAGEEGYRRVNLRWKRTSHHAVDGKTAHAWSGRNWKLVSADDDVRDTVTDGIVAVFTSNPDLTADWGTLQINVDWGIDFERILLLSITLLNRLENL